MPKPKKVNFVLIEGDSEPYRILNEVRSAHHPDTRDASIALAWRRSLTPDADGHLVLGKCQRTTDLQREFMPYDFIILLNQEVWNDKEFGPEKKAALIDHELCHAEVALGRDGEPKLDERGRRVWRTRKHDIEEFRAVVSRHGCYKYDLEKFAETLLRRRATEKEMVTA